MGKNFLQSGSSAWSDLILSKVRAGKWEFKISLIWNTLWFLDRRGPRASLGMGWLICRMSPWDPAWKGSLAYCICKTDAWLRWMCCCGLSGNSQSLRDAHAFWMAPVECFSKIWSNFLKTWKMSWIESDGRPKKSILANFSKSNFLSLKTCRCLWSALCASSGRLKTSLQRINGEEAARGTIRTGRLKMKVLQLKSWLFWTTLTLQWIHL